MWTCPQCKTRNLNNASKCENCGALPEAVRAEGLNEATEEDLGGGEDTVAGEAVSAFATTCESNTAVQDVVPFPPNLAFLRGFLYPFGVLIPIYNIFFLISMTSGRNLRPLWVVLLLLGPIAVVAVHPPFSLALLCNFLYWGSISWLAFKRYVNAAFGWGSLFGIIFILSSLGMRFGLLFR